VNVRAGVPEPKLHRPSVPGVTIGVLAAGFWLVYGISRGATGYGDSASYIALADAISRGLTVDTVRAPGYPLFIAFCRGLAALLGTDELRVLVVAQVILCAGLSTYLVYDIGWRLTQRRSVGTIAALLMAADVDLQHFTSAVVSESLSVALAVGSLWLRIRDQSWRRAAWLIAALVLTRPNLVFLPLAFAVGEAVRTRRILGALRPLWPTAVVTGVWLVGTVLRGGDPLTASEYFGPLHAFGKVYESKLWREIPDAGEREVVADAKRRGLDVYQAAAAVADAPGGWKNLASVASDVVRVDPIGYLRACVDVVPRELRQRTYWPRGTQSWGRSARFGERFSWMERWWRPVYHTAFYGSFPLFLGLLALAWLNGLGWPGAVRAMRDTLVPFVAVLFFSVAMLSLGVEEVARLALSFHPVNGLVWALALGRTWEALRVRASQPA